MSVVAFYIGYSPYYTSDNWLTPEIAKNIGGSEIATIQVALHLSKKKNTVVIFGHHITSEETTKDGITWKPTAAFDAFNEKNKIDALIIVRYINALVYLKNVIKIPKIYVWLHDLIVHYSLMGEILPYYASGIIENFKDHITAIGCQTPWHSSFLASNYPSLTNKFIFTPNGVSDELVSCALNKRSTPQRVPNKFIFASTHSRGLPELLKLWPEITRRLENASLVIYGSADLPQPVSELVAPFSNVTVKEKAPQLELFKEMQTSDVWFYPTNFEETYCMTALEAMFAGCLCIFYDFGCL